MKASPPQPDGEVRTRRPRHRGLVACLVAGTAAAVLVGLPAWSARSHDAGLAAVREAVDACWSRRRPGSATRRPTGPSELTCA